MKLMALWMGNSKVQSAVLKWMGLQLLSLIHLQDRLDLSPSIIAFGPMINLRSILKGIANQISPVQYMQTNSLSTRLSENKSWIMPGKGITVVYLLMDKPEVENPIL